MNTVHIENWGELIIDGDIDLTCPTCKGSCTMADVTLSCQCTDCEHEWACHLDEYIPLGEMDDPEDATTVQEQMPSECPNCGGEDIDIDVDHDNVGCEDCSSGYIEPLWNTIWDTGFRAKGRDLPREFGNVFAFDYEGTVAFGLTCCGMDCTPYLASAYIEMFGEDCILPDEFMVTGINLRGGYIRSCVGETQARKVYKAMRNTIRSMQMASENVRVDLDEAEKELTNSGSQSTSDD